MSKILRSDFKTYYFKCPTCNYISHSLDLMLKSFPCPNCKAKNESRELFPPHISQMIFVRVYNFYKRYRRLKYKSQGEGETVVILTASLLEGLFNDFLINLLEKEKVSYKIAVIFVEKLGQIGNFCDKFNLFEKITNHKFKTSIKNYGDLDYYKDWELIRRKRNEFMHAKTYILKSEVVEKALKLANTSFGLFAELNNKYCLRS